MAANPQGSSHSIRAVGFRLRNRKDFVYEFIGITAERDGDRNPLVRFNDPLHRVIDILVDNETVIRVLKEEAAENNGHLEIDTRSCFILKDS